MYLKNNKKIPKSLRLDLTILTRLSSKTLKPHVLYCLPSAGSVLHHHSLGHRLGPGNLTRQENEWVVQYPKKGSNMREEELWGHLSNGCVGHHRNGACVTVTTIISFELHTDVPGIKSQCPSQAYLSAMHCALLVLNQVPGSNLQSSAGIIIKQASCLCLTTLLKCGALLDRWEAGESRDLITGPVSCACL